MHRAIPRTIAVAVIAAPRRRGTLRLIDRTATIRFLVRRIDALQVELMRTDVGDRLVTTPEQKVLDLAHLPNIGEMEREALAAVRTLLPRCDQQVLADIATSQRLGRALIRVQRMAAAGFGLSCEDLGRYAARFGVADDQVRLEHAISHILAAVFTHLPDKVIFFGGTALNRTHLLRPRLSEDIDLIALGSRREVAERLTNSINAGLLRSHGRPSWSPPFSPRDAEPAVIEFPAGIAIRTQLFDRRGYQPWPTETRPIGQRYRDAPLATLIVPTIESFAGWKTAAWYERRAPRDLYDLWALAEQRALTEQAADLFARHGTTGTPPREFMFARAPSEDEWLASGRTPSASNGTDRRC